MKNFAIKFRDDYNDSNRSDCFYIEAEDILDALNKIRFKDWFSDFNQIIEIKLDRT